MNWKTIINPFQKFSSAQLIGVGVIFFGLSIYFQYLFGYQLYAILNAREPLTPQIIPLQNIILNTLFCNLLVITVLFIYGKIINKKTRIIDIVNTVLIGQIPFILCVPLTHLPFIYKSSERVKDMVLNKMETSIPTPDLIITASFGLFILGIVIYCYALLFNGFKTATNMKKTAQIIILILLLIITTTLVNTAFL